MWRKITESEIDEWESRPSSKTFGVRLPDVDFLLWTEQPQSDMNIIYKEGSFFWHHNIIRTNGKTLELGKKFVLNFGWVRELKRKTK